MVNALKKNTCSKHLLLILVISFFCNKLFSQSFNKHKNDISKEWQDSTKYSKNNLEQFRAFRANEYPYPPKPRDQWEIGLHLGVPLIYGDIQPQIGIGGGISARKSFGHVFSIRLDYTGGLERGISSYLYTTGYGIWQKYYTGIGNPYVPNYRTITHQFNVDFIAVLNNGSHYRGNPWWNIYVFGGPVLLYANTTVDALNSNGVPYNFSNINFQQSNSAVIRNVKQILQGNYISQFQPQGSSAITTFGNGANLLLGASGGIGAAFKLNKRLNIGVEERVTYPLNSNLDGFSATNRNAILYTSVRLNINIGNASKRTEPLWWINPNNYVYTELTEPRHIKLPKIVLPDSDNDGVTDQFDLEPNTPAGAPVDTHGVTKDTDGDGVPDYRDKEPLTPLNCFPVNEDGVGTCPEPACCKELRDIISNMQANGTSNNNNGGNNNGGNNNGENNNGGNNNGGNNNGGNNNGGNNNGGNNNGGNNNGGNNNGGSSMDCISMNNLPSIKFNAKSNNLTPNAIAILDFISDKLKANPNAKINVIGYITSSHSKAEQQLSWDRVNTTIKYLFEKEGISEDRLFFNYGKTGSNPNIINFNCTTETNGMNIVPAPHPNLKK